MNTERAKNRTTNPRFFLKCTCTKCGSISYELGLPAKCPICETILCKGEKTAMLGKRCSVCGLQKSVVEFPLNGDCCKKCHKDASIKFDKTMIRTRDTKKCPHCGQTKLVTDFSRDRMHKSGRRSWCKLCLQSPDQKLRAAEYNKVYRFKQKQKNSNNINPQPPIPQNPSNEEVTVLDNFFGNLQKMTNEIKDLRHDMPILADKIQILFQENIELKNELNEKKKKLGQWAVIIAEQQRIMCIDR